MFLLPIHVVSCSHEHNPHALVGRVRLTPEQLTDALGALHAHGANAVLLSTCHRTELYWWGNDDLAVWFREHVVQRIRGGNMLAIDRADADLAVRHLFAVASGMRSVRFGEPEIAGQVRRAWQAARDAQVVTGSLDRIFRQAIDASRHIRDAMGSDADPTLGMRVRTCIAERMTPRLPPAYRARVLVIGAGDAARTVLAALAAEPLPACDVAVTSRTDARASALGAEFAVPTVPWADRDSAVAAATVVVFAVHVTSPMVGGVAQSLSLPLAHPDTHQHPHPDPAALWIDLGVPGAVATGFSSRGIELVTVDQLEDEAAPAVRDARARRSNEALQYELARCDRESHRAELGQRLSALEDQAAAFVAAHDGEPADDLARRVARLMVRELTRA